jgi:hypothetical protein
MAKSKSFTDFMAAYKSGHLLDLEMPNGRALRDCTADDCFAYGGWLEKVGRRVRHGWSAGNDQVDHTGRMTVGDTYKEVALQWQFLAFHVLELQWAPAHPSNVDPGDEFDGGNFR